MINDGTPQPVVRHQLWIVFGIWLVIGASMIWFARGSIAQRMFPDPDDAMRLLQVRDWLGGQSWFDVTQYRLNPPSGGPMHWSRIIDLPIAAVILLTRPLVGQYNAETAALVFVPLLTLGVAMLLVHRIALKLTTPGAALLAVFATPASLGAMKQMRIMRIDHHGWQIVFALLATLATLDKSARRAGLIAGLAVGVWLNVSIEALPFGAAVGAWFAFEWLRDPAAGERLKSYVGWLAVSSLVLFLLTHAPAVWLAHPHDVLNCAHLAGFAVAAVGLHFAVRPDFGSLWLRIGVLAGAGAATLAAMFAVDPHVMQAPFDSLDPLVKTLWYDAVDEGQPIWHLSRTDAAAALAQPLVGLLGALVALRKAPAEQRDGWLAFTWLLFAGMVSSIFVVREATMASMLSLPGTAFLCEFALLRARKVSVMPVRVVATAGALCVMAPAYAVPASVTPADPRFTKAIQSSDSCVSRTELLKLNALPPSNLAVPLDITPAILVMTPHTAIASGYHRNGDGIRDVILLFIGTPDKAQQILVRRHIDYIAFCPQTPESLWWAGKGHNDLAAMLNANRAPAWLQPVDLHLHALRVWRVRKDMIAGEHA